MVHKDRTYTPLDFFRNVKKYGITGAIKEDWNRTTLPAKLTLGGLIFYLMPKPAYAEHQTYDSLISELDSSERTSWVYFNDDFFRGIGDGIALNPVILVNAADSVSGDSLTTLIDSLDAYYPNAAIYAWMNDSTANVFRYLGGSHDTLEYNINSELGTDNHYDALVNTADNGEWVDTTAMNIGPEDQGNSKNPLYTLRDGKLYFTNGKGFVKILDPTGRTLLTANGSEIDIRELLTKQPSGKYFINGFAPDSDGKFRKVRGSIFRIK